MSIELYLVKLLVGNEGMPGAPLLHLSTAVDAPTGHVTGQAEITQAIRAPEGHIRITHLKGQLRSLGLEPAVRVLTLKGTYTVSVPPPEIGTYLADFSATLVIGQDSWNGRGSFTYGDHEVTDVPVKVLED
jgi:hypothetical protein